MIQNLPTKSAVEEVFPLASQHFDIRFLISLRLVGMTGSFPPPYTIKLAPSSALETL